MESVEMELTESYTFKHFETSIECDHYIRDNLRGPFAYKCCGGKGFATLLKNPPKHMMTKPKDSDKTRHDLPKVTNGTCEICFMDNKPLYSTCNCCKQPFCLDCLKQISKTCPYCRGTLNLLYINL